MSTGLKLSPKHGLNPTIPVCFWCGKERGDIALLGRIGDIGKGEDIEAEKHTVIDYEPCGACLAKMDAGFAVIEATDSPNKITSVPLREDIYPTGRYAVITQRAATRIFGGLADDTSKCFLDDDDFKKIFVDRPCHGRLIEKPDTKSVEVDPDASPKLYAVGSQAHLKKAN